MSRRARSAERLGPSLVGEPNVGRLADILERMMTEPRPARTPFKTPQFEGTGDIEYFIQQFNSVAEANEWEPEAKFLHLREALREGARDCGRAGTIDGIFTALRARYGLSPKEARLQLNTLKKRFQTSLQEHATEVQRLTEVAHGELPPQYRDTLALEAFSSSLGNAYLQRHLLAMNVRDMDSAVRAGNEFLQVKVGRPEDRSSVRLLEEELDQQVQPVKTAEAETTTLTKALLQLTTQMEKIQSQLNTSQRTARRNSTRSGSKCWGCGKEGHLQRNCPTHSQSGQTKLSGNGPSPQQ